MTTPGRPDLGAALGCLAWLFGLGIVLAIWSSSDCDPDLPGALPELFEPAR